jgi:tetratricopeptide (TPR) repeat protein
MSETPSSAGETFGARLRRLRQAAGLSQIELAGDQLHPSYVSLLEAGKRTPTSDVVGLLASRLGCTPEYLSEGDSSEATARIALALAYAELALRNGEAPDALDQADRALQEDQLSADQRRALRTVRAEALEGVGRLREAAGEFEALANDAAAAGRWTEHLERLVDLSRCYQDAGDVTYALELGVATLDRVGELGLSGSDVHARLAATVVGGYYLREDLTRAAAVAEQALAALDGGTPRARGSVLWNASLVAQAAGRVEEALPLAEQALAQFAEGDDARAIARLRVTYGWLLLRDTPPRPEEARAALHQALTSLRDVGSAVDLSSCERELAVAALQLGEPEEALAHVERAAEHLGDEPTLALADTQLIRGRVLLVLGRKARAVTQYRAAGATLGALELSRAAASAWRELADAFTGLGLFEDAALAYQQALSEAGVPPAPSVAVVSPHHARVRERRR